ncbi:MAG: BrnT family toxin [Myxococcota bacterium]
MLRFEWDEAKNAENKRKHRVSFEEAETVFYDDWGVLVEDEDEEEERFVLIGTSGALRVLVVSHCYRARDQVIRLISARKATRSERKAYETRWKR